MGKFLCFLGFHKFSIWKDDAHTLKVYDSQYLDIPSHEYSIQQKRCNRCNLLKSRRVEI
jgi:hypothetical protein